MLRKMMSLALMFVIATCLSTVTGANQTTSSFYTVSQYTLADAGLPSDIVQIVGQTAVIKIGDQDGIGDVKFCTVKGGEVILSGQAIYIYVDGLRINGHEPKHLVYYASEFEAGGEWKVVLNGDRGYESLDIEIQFPALDNNTASNTTKK